MSRDALVRYREVKALVTSCLTVKSQRQWSHSKGVAVRLDPRSVGLLHVEVECCMGHGTQDLLIRESEDRMCGNGWRPLRGRMIYRHSAIDNGEEEA